MDFGEKKQRGTHPDCTPLNLMLKQLCKE